MAILLKANNAKSLVTDNPLAQAAVTVNVTGAEGALFPAGGDFMLTIWDKASFPNPGDDAGMEIVRATARTDDAITIVRAQESTADVEHTQGEAVEMLITAGTFGELPAQDVDIVDAGTHYTGTEVETALAEIGAGTTLDTRYPTRTEWLQNGFPNRADTTIAWDNANRRMTINPTGVSFNYFIQGVKYNVATSDVINVNRVDIADTEGLHIFYYDGAVLTTIANPTDAQIETATLTKALISYVYWDVTNSLGELMEDRHGLSMSPDTHRELHFTTGTTYFDGLALGDFVISDGADDEDAQFSVATGHIFDEDIKHTLNAIGKLTGLEVWYRNAALDWRKDTQAGFSVLNAGAGRVYYDDAGTLTEVTDGNWVLYHIFTTSNADLNPISIMGQAEYAKLKDARIGATTEMSSLLLGSLPSKEMKAIATVIFQTDDTYGNTVKARVVQTDEGDNYIDWRTSSLSPSAPAQDHGSLAGLADDDHPAYILDAGTVVDNSIPAFDGTDGRTTQPTGVTIDDSDNMAGVGTLGCGTITSTGNLIVDGGDIGITADTDLLQLADGALTVNGSILPTVAVGGAAAYVPNSYLTRVYLNSTAYLDGAGAGVIAGTGAMTLTGNPQVNGGDIGITADTNLMQLAANALTVNGAVSLAGGVTGADPTPRITMGSYYDNAGDASISHLDLYGGSYGWGIQAGILDHISGGGHKFYDVNNLATPRMYIASIGVGGYVQIAGAVVPSSASGSNLGSTTLEWLNVFVGTGRVYVGATQAGWMYDDGTYTYFGRT